MSLFDLGQRRTKADRAAIHRIMRQWPHGTAVLVDGERRGLVDGCGAKSGKLFVLFADGAREKVAQSRVAKV